MSLIISLCSTLEGFYVDDALQGQAIYTYEDGGALHGTYADGELNGPAQEFDLEGHLVFRGQYKDNIRCGMCWTYYPVGFAWLGYLMNVTKTFTLIMHIMTKVLIIVPNLF